MVIFTFHLNANSICNILELLIYFLYVNYIVVIYMNIGTIPLLFCCTKFCGFLKEIIVSYKTGVSRPYLIFECLWLLWFVFLSFNATDKPTTGISNYLTNNIKTINGWSVSYTVFINTIFFWDIKRNISLIFQNTDILNCYFVKSFDLFLKQAKDNDLTSHKSIEYRNFTIGWQNQHQV